MTTTKIIIRNGVLVAFPGRSRLISGSYRDQPWNPTTHRDHHNNKLQLPRTNPFHLSENNRLKVNAHYFFNKFEKSDDSLSFSSSDLISFLKVCIFFCAIA